MHHVLYLDRYGAMVGESFIDHDAACSIAYFCSTCGDVWARAFVENAPSWLLQSTPCERHDRTGVPDWASQPGSFLTGLYSCRFTGAMLWAATEEYLPPNILRREFVLRHNIYREAHGNSALPTS